MCGFVGFIGSSNKNILEKMNATIIHRGPDAGETIILDERTHLGHRRLSILDLTETGRQPMVSHDNRWTIVFNGEIYNFHDIRAQLTRNWRGSSDTEVLLEAISEWGVDGALKKTVGMFAFAIFDNLSKTLILARDRFGEKPLYYGQLNNTFFFGSELKAFRPHPAFKPTISKQALKSYFKYNYIPAPFSVYEEIKKLKPGHFIEVDANSFETKVFCYWSLQPKTNFKGSFNEASSELEKILKTSVSRQMLSDVPLGAFLSGGVDSSLIAALMQSISPTPIKTFTIGFNETNFNEAIFAKEVANHLGTEHTELYVTPKDALDVIGKLPEIFDEPFADVSQIPTYLLCQMTKKHVTVSLSGDAGDEVFGGYGRYFMAKKASNYLGVLPAFAKASLAQSMRSIPPALWDKISPVRGDKIHKLAGLINSQDETELYLKLVSFWDDQENPVASSDGPMKFHFNDKLPGLEEKMMFLDTLTYLPDDILVKVDRAGMSVSLETRVPFLDHEVVEFVWSLPLDFKIQQNKGKRILRDVLYRHVPQALIDRPKKGFSTPVGSWLRSDLKTWAEDLLSEEKIKKQGLLNYAVIKKKWDEHQCGVRNWQSQLWNVLMFQVWYEKYHS